MSRAYTRTTSGAVSGLVLGELAHLEVRETSGSAAALVKVYDGTDTSGQLLAEVRVATSTTDWRDFSHPVAFLTGLYIDVTSGAAEVVAHVR